jgi:hypothetical protein
MPVIAPSHPVIEPFDPLSEKPISLSQAASLMPEQRCGKRLTKDTISRWITHGIRPKAATDRRRRVRLQAVQIGLSLYTSRESIGRFIQRLTIPDQPADQSTPEQRRASHQLAVHQLQAAGLLGPGDSPARDTSTYSPAP